MLSDRFCQMPFSFAEIHQGGNVFFCCPTWSGFRSIGNVFRDSSADLWNSLEAQEIRTGILDGSFRGCDCAVCPEIVSGNLPPRTKEHDAYGPTLLYLSIANRREAGEVEDASQPGFLWGR